MTKFAGAQTVSRSAPGPLGVDGPTLTHEGAPAYALDAKSELFTLAVTNFVEPTYYERDEARQARFVQAIHRCVSEDAGWVARLAAFARDKMQMRSASVVIACEYVKAGGPNGRAVINAVCVRADEPAEVIGYWMSRYGRQIPKAVKRGVSDAARRLYTERSVLRYDGQRSSVRMGDVLELAHVKPTDEAQSALFKYLIDSRHKREDAKGPGGIAEVEAWVAAGAAVDALPRLMSWERLSTYTKMDAPAWEAVIPQMGAMALVRNLRNFDEAGISDAAVDLVVSRLQDEDEIRKSRQFPYRFYTAYREVKTLRWGPALERAIKHATKNIPAIPGSTLILTDVSGSMSGSYGSRATVAPWEVAGVFAGAAAQACEKARVVAFATQAAEMEPVGDILRFMPLLAQAMNRLGGGTNIYQALAAAYQGEDRVIIFTDMQAHDAWRSEFERIPNVYAFDLAGYGRTGLDLSKPGRYQLGGFSDACFPMFELLERGRRADWPF